MKRLGQAASSMLDKDTVRFKEAVERNACYALDVNGLGPHWRFPVVLLSWVIGIRDLKRRTARHRTELMDDVGQDES